MTLFVTGGTGFIGRALVRELDARGLTVRRGVRAPTWKSGGTGITDAVIGDLTEPGELVRALRGVRVAIHLAGWSGGRSQRSRSKCQAVNTVATERLARSAVEAGVRRLVFMSTVKVCGEITERGRPFRESDPARPRSPYAVSKFRAEQGLWEIGARSGMEIVVVRPPLVYGPQVTGNFLRLMQWVDRGLPLPFGAVENARSMIGMPNLVDFIIRCVDHPAAANETFFVSDGVDLSTHELLMAMASALGRRTRVISPPIRLLDAGLRVIGKGLSERLCQSLQVDTAKARSLLGWSPAVAIDDALRDTATAFLTNMRE